MKGVLFIAIVLIVIGITWAALEDHCGDFSGGGFVIAFVTIVGISLIFGELQSGTTTKEVTLDYEVLYTRELADLQYPTGTQKNKTTLPNGSNTFLLYNYRDDKGVIHFEREPCDPANITIKDELSAGEAPYIVKLKESATIYTKTEHPDFGDSESVQYIDEANFFYIVFCQPGDTADKFILTG